MPGIWVCVCLQDAVAVCDPFKPEAWTICCGLQGGAAEQVWRQLLRLHLDPDNSDDMAQ
jgi:hypothetical protein